MDDSLDGEDVIMKIIDECQTEQSQQKVKEEGEPKAKKSKTESTATKKESTVKKETVTFKEEQGVCTFCLFYRSKM